MAPGVEVEVINHNVLSFCLYFYLNNCSPIALLGLLGCHLIEKGLSACSQLMLVFISIDPSDPLIQSEEKSFQPAFNWEALRCRLSKFHVVVNMKHSGLAPCKSVPIYGPLTEPKISKFGRTAIPTLNGCLGNETRFLKSADAKILVLSRACTYSFMIVA